MDRSLPSRGDTESPLRVRLEALTPNQRLVLQTLQQEADLISAQDLFAKLRKTEKIGLATIYRALETLKVAGFIQHQVNRSGESLYQVLGQDCHSLTCLQCGESVPIQGCPVQKLEQDLQAHHSFRIYYHTLEFFGLCEPCAQLQG
ncbi:MAG: Zinc uptake regulation protein [Cyanobacteriota bacterium]|jgi:Fur family ferric uptake transcriptional regulator